MVRVNTELWRQIAAINCPGPYPLIQPAMMTWRNPNPLLNLVSWLFIWVALHPNKRANKKIKTHQCYKNSSLPNLIFFKSGISGLTLIHVEPSLKEHLKCNTATNHLVQRSKNSNTIPLIWRHFWPNWNSTHMAWRNESHDLHRRKREHWKKLPVIFKCALITSL